MSRSTLAETTVTPNVAPASSAAARAKSTARNPAESAKLSPPASTSTRVTFCSRRPETAFVSSSAVCRSSSPSRATRPRPPSRRVETEKPPASRSSAAVMSTSGQPRRKQFPPRDGTKPAHHITRTREWVVPGTDVVVLVLAVVSVALTVTTDDETDQNAPEVAVADQRPIPDDERPVVEIDPVAAGDGPLPDDERPVPDTGAEAARGATLVPDDERPVPDDDEPESR